VKDIDFASREIRVRDGKGRKDRVTPLPESLVTPLQHHLESVRATFERDLAEGCGDVSLPDALDRKYARGVVSARRAARPVVPPGRAARLAHAGKRGALSYFQAHSPPKDGSLAARQIWYGLR